MNGRVTSRISPSLCSSDGGSVDPSSDWNAPSEAWGNYEEPTPEPAPAQQQPPPEPTKASLVIGAAVSEPGV